MFLVFFFVLVLGLPQIAFAVAIPSEEPADTPVAQLTPIATTTSIITPTIEPTPLETSVASESSIATVTPTEIAKVAASEAPKITGDFNSDQVVNLQDFQLLANNFNNRMSEGDLNGDGVINIQDFILLSNRFNRTT